MKTVVLIPYVNTVEFGLFDTADTLTAVRGTLHAHADEDELQKIIRGIAQHTGQPAEVIQGAAFVVRLPYSGQALAAPTHADEQLLARLESLVPDAPLHLPRCIELIRACLLLTAAPVVVVSETGYFVDLPDEEAVYAIDFALQEQLRVRRYGFHGVYHRHASIQAANQIDRTDDQTMKVISICLEPRPELAAVVGDKPVMVSGGTTPLEGLCGTNACGDVDPGIVLQLVRSKGWDHERINRCLGRESGMTGLTGRQVTWDHVFDELSPQTQPARAVFKYHLLRHCGAAIAIMGGVDAIVFSGRSNHLADKLGGWLVEHLEPAIGTEPPLIRDRSLLVDLVYREAADTPKPVGVGA